MTDEAETTLHQHATQVFLAIMLAARNKERADSAEKFIQLINKVAPRAVEAVQYEELKQFIRDLEKTGWKSNKSKKTRLHWQSFDHEFNWYTWHTLRELESAIQIHRDTIRKKFKAKKKTKKGRQRMFNYSPAECLKILDWWLSEYLPKKVKKEPDFPFRVGQSILLNLRDQDLSAVAKRKVAQVIEDICGHEVRYLSGMSSPVKLGFGLRIDIGDS